MNNIHWFHWDWNITFIAAHANSLSTALFSRRLTVEVNSLLLDLVITTSWVELDVGVLNEWNLLSFGDQFALFFSDTGTVATLHVVVWNWAWLSIALFDESFLSLAVFATISRFGAVADSALHFQSTSAQIGTSTPSPLRPSSVHCTSLGVALGLFSCASNARFTTSFRFGVIAFTTSRFDTTTAFL